MDIKNLSLKDKLLLVKAAEKLTDNTYKAMTDTILKQLMKEPAHIYKSKLGTYTIQHTPKEPTTVADEIAKLEKDIAEKQAKVEALKLLDKNDIVVNTKLTVRAIVSQTATDIAKELLQDVMTNLDSTRIQKKLNQQ